MCSFVDMTKIGEVDKPLGVKPEARPSISANRVEVPEFTSFWGFVKYIAQKAAFTFNFNTRISRLEFLYSIVWLAMVFAIPTVILQLAPLMALITLPLSIYSMVLTIKIYIQRLHDLWHSWWAVLLLLVPFVNLYFMIKIFFFRWVAWDNEYGNDTNDKFTSSNGVVWWYGLAQILLVVVIYGLWLWVYIFQDILN